MLAQTMRPAAASVSVSPQRLKRWLTCTWLWLLKYAAFLCFSQRAEPWRRDARRDVRDLILIRAAQMLRPRRCCMHRRAPPPRGFCYAATPNIRRAAFGARLRRRLYVRGAGHAIAVLFAALQDIEQLACARLFCAARLAMRLHPPRPRRRRAPIRLERASQTLKLRQDYRS